MNFILSPRIIYINRRTATMPNSKYLTACIVILLSACGKSPLSEQDVLDISLLRVHISIADSPKHDTIDSIFIRLIDEQDRDVYNENIRIRVESEIESRFLDHYEKTELYYTKTRGYRTNAFDFSQSLFFEISLTDGSSYPLAYIRPPAKVDINNIVAEETATMDEPYLIQWSDLKNLNQLRITKSVRELGTNMHRGGEKVFELEVDPAEGRYIVEKNFYLDSDPDTIIEFLSYEFSGSAKGLLNPWLLPGSRISASMSYEHTISFEKSE